MDGIQSLTGCTLGKGNLVFHNYGKHVYTFLRRSDGRAIRVVIRPDYWSQRDPEHQALSTKMIAGEATEAERARFQELQHQRADALLAIPEEQLLEMQLIELEYTPKRRAADYVLCPVCGELTLRTHLRTAGSRQVCQPCAARLSASQ